MRISKLIMILLMAVMLVPGCEQNATEEASVTPPDTTDDSGGESGDKVQVESVATGDDEKLVSEIKAIANSVKTDSRGFVTEIDFRKTEVTDEDLDKLTELKNLQKLFLNETNISDAALIPIGKITSLRDLDLRQVPIGNEGLAHLTELSNLRALRLSGQSGEHGATSVDDGGMESVGKLKNLKALLLDYLWISGDGLSKLGDLNNLEEIYLAGTLVGDADLEQIKLFPNLKKLRISKLAQVTGAGLEHVKTLKNLIDLDLSENSSLFDQDLEPLAEMTTLQRLNLWRVAMTDVGVSHLKGLTDLRWLNLDNTQLTDAGLSSLTDMTKLEFLHLGSTAVTDEGIQQLSALKSLKDLKVTRTAVTEDGVKKLQEDLPETEIQLKYLGDGT